MPKANPRTGRGTAEERRYYAWLKGMPCCLTGNTDGVQFAHTGAWGEGKGLGQKAALWTVLPLHHVLHAVEERGRQLFWTSVKIEPVPWATRLYDQFTKDNRHEAELILAEMRQEANRDFLVQILRRSAA